MRDKKYHAYISYSHADEKWARWLHTGLERLRVPRGMEGGNSGRLFPIFRDREELPLAGNLDRNILDALEASRWLVVVCSPRSAASKWVDLEIRYFKRLGRGDRIFSVIVDGEPNASAKGAAAVECFPEALRYEVDRDQRLQGLPREPVAADAREGRDGRGNALIKVAAALLGVDYNTLRQRERQQRRLRSDTVMALVVVLLLGFGGVAGHLWYGRHLAEQERDRLQRELQKALSDLEALRPAPGITP